MRAVICSDAHGDHVTMGVARFGDVERAFARVAAQVADVHFFLGDLTDPEDGMAALRATTMLANHASRVVAGDRGPRFIAIPGNHDVFEDGSGESTLQVLGALSPEVTLLSGPTACVFDRESADAFNVVALPFTASSHAYAPDKFVREVVEHPDRYGLVQTAPTFVIGHLMIPGVQPGEETKEVPRGREVMFPFEAVRDLCASMRGDVFVTNGHYHRRQEFKPSRMGYTIHIPGAMARLTMGEERHEPAFLVVEV